MYKKYNLNELAQTIQVLKEKNAKDNPGEEIGLFTLMGKIGFDLKEVKDFAEYCGLRLYDSKYNKDFEYKSQIEKTNFKKYLQKEREKISGILERLEKREPIGKWKGERKETCKNIKPESDDIIPPRSDEGFGIALEKLIDHSSIDVEMLSHLIDCEVFKIQGYLTGRYRDPPKEFIEEISDFFNVDPRYFKEYREYLGKDYKEDRPITLVNYRITKKRREIFELPEQSNEEFKESVRKLICASGIEIDKLASIMHCQEASLFKYLNKAHSLMGHKDNKLFKKGFIEGISKFFNISPGYFKEYRENEIKDKLLAGAIKHKKKKEKGRERQKRFNERNPDKVREGNKRFRENNPGYSKEYYKNNPEKAKEERRRYYKRNSKKMKENNKRFKKNNPGYSKEYYNKTK